MLWRKCLKKYFCKFFFSLRYQGNWKSCLRSLRAHTPTPIQTHTQTQTFPEALCPLFIYPCDNMFACFSPGGTRKRSSLIGLISMLKHPLCLAVPQLIVLGFGINNIYFSKSHHYLFLNLVLSVCFSVILFSVSVMYLGDLSFGLLWSRRAPHLCCCFSPLCSKSFSQASCKCVDL